MAQDKKITYSVSYKMWYIKDINKYSSEEENSCITIQYKKKPSSNKQ